MPLYETFTSVVDSLRDRVLKAERLSAQECLSLIEAPVHTLFEASTAIREHYRGNRVDLCSIINAKSGGCSEDCAFCAQSSRHETDVQYYPLLDSERILQRAREAVTWGARRFCIVTSGRKVTPKEIDRIAETIARIKGLGLLPCATLGILTKEELQTLKDAGLYRYHHNIETSRRFFKEVCTTHTFEEKLKTIEAAMTVGLSVCSGGLFGLGETWQDRVEMALLLRELGVDSVPINFLIPIKGTPLGNKQPLPALEALRIVSLFRFLLPDREIRVCGGRVQTLKGLQSMIFFAGADGLLIGNYLTQKGSSVEDDLFVISSLGLEPITPSKG